MKNNSIDDEVTFKNKFSNQNRGNRRYTENSERHPRFHDDSFKKHERKHFPKIVETKLFTDKSELVKYVNEKGQSNALIDIYKIEEELYKLVIKR